MYSETFIYCSFGDTDYSNELMLRSISIVSSHLKDSRDQISASSVDELSELNSR